MLSTFKINKKFIEEVWSSQKQNKLLSTEEIQEFANLLELVMTHQNQPKKRNGYSKARVLKNWLQERGIQAEVIPVENFDKRKRANAQGKWYIVEATVGEKNFGKDTINGVLLTHHDQVAKSINEFQRSQTKQRITHPWILDDSVHLVAAMIEFVRFNNWWKENSQNYNKKISVKLIISDGEEMNTLGMRGLLNLWKEQKVLNPVNFMIVGESTGKGDKVPGVAYTNSGKILGTIGLKLQEAKSCNTVLNFLVRFRIAQKYLRIKSSISPYSKIEKVKFSKLSSTYGKITKDSAKLFWEIRTNSIVDTDGSSELFSEIMTTSNKNLKKYLKEIRDYEIKKGVNYNLDFKQVYSHVKIEGSNVLQIRVDRSYHPGAYDPFNMNDIFSALEVLLFFMTEDELAKVQGIDFGDMDKPNTVGNTLYVEVKDGIDLDQIISRIEDKRNTLNVQILDGYKRCIPKLSNTHIWNVENDEFVLPRSSVGKYKDNKWLADIARENLRLNVYRSSGKRVTVPLTVFNAMHDGGPTTYSEYRNDIWAKGENVIVLGTGDFSTLHGGEYLTNETFLYGILQYRGLLGQIVGKLAL